MDVLVFGRNVRNLRYRRGLSPREMAVKLELTEELLLLLCGAF